jgi:hypothetical protein
LIHSTQFEPNRSNKHHRTIFYYREALILYKLTHPSLPIITRNKSSNPSKHTPIQAHTQDPGRRRTKGATGELLQVFYDVVETDNKQDLDSVATFTLHITSASKKGSLLLIAITAIFNITTIISTIITSIIITLCR